MIGRAGRGEGPPTLRGMLARGHLQLVLLAVALASASLMVSGLFALRGYATQNVALAAQTLAYAAEPTLVFGDREAALRLVSELGTNDNLAAIAIDDAAGRPFVRWHNAGAVGVDFGPVLSNWLGLGPVEKRVTFRGEAVGTVRVVGGIGAIFRYTLAALIIAVSCLGITVLATRILARRLEDAIAAPLDRVAEIAHDVMNERRLSRRLGPSGIAEIDRFAHDFNALLAELESWHNTLANENAELSRRADRDPLTGLGNRARLERNFEIAIDEAQRVGSEVVLLYCDCNGFKQINDTHGHDAGDAIICVVADRLRLASGDTERVFRIGGDEFAILLDANGRAGAAEEAARVRAAVHEAMAGPVALALGVEVSIGLSVGHASYPEDGHTLRRLMRLADMRMYRDKRGEPAL